MPLNQVFGFYPESFSPALTPVEQECKDEK